MKWLYGIIALGIIVFIHEAGHFIAAKLCGVYVESFSLGYGPVLLHKTIHGTDYRLSLFPLGGYCGMRGEDDFRKAMEEGRDAIAAAPGSLYAVHPLLRAVIGAAGPMFNVLFAAAAMSFISFTGYSYKSYSPKVRMADEVFEGMHSAAKDAGMMTGDVIKRIDGKEIVSFADIIMAVSPRPGEVLSIVIERGGKELTMMVHTDSDKGQGKIGASVYNSELLTFEVPRKSFLPALLYGAKEACTMVSLTFKAIGMLFKGLDPRYGVSGPVRITNMLGTAAEEGFEEGAREGFASVLDLMAAISVSLFVMNLLPIPVLDGGLVLFALIAFCTGREIKPRYQYRAQMAGIIVIVLLFLLGFSSDIAYFFGKRGEL